MPYIYMYDYDDKVPGFVEVAQIRLCIKCEHYHPHTEMGPQCRRINPEVVDPVTGITHRFSDLVHGGIRCYEERQSTDVRRCGPQGRNWKQRKP